MKKATIILALIVAYAVFLSIGLECLLKLMGVSFAISLDGGSVVKQYPRFIPFCVIVGLLALTALVILVVLNTKAAKKLHFTKTIWWVQIISAIVLSIPMMKLWEMLFAFLQKAC